MLTNSELNYLSWYVRMVKATPNLSERESLSLEAWMCAGEKRSTWPGWEEIIGPHPKPVERRKQPGIIQSERRRIA